MASSDERASLIVTSNKAFGRWGEVFGNEVVATAMIDRFVHHANVVDRKGDSYRLKNQTSAGFTPNRRHRMNPKLVKFHLSTTDSVSVAVDRLPQLHDCLDLDTSNEIL